MLGSKVGSTVIITKAGKSRFISCLMKTIIPSMTESFKIIRNTYNTLNTPLCLFGHHSISKVTSPPKQRAIQSSHRSTASQRSVAEIKQTRPRIGLPPDRSHRHVRIPLSGNRREPNPISCARAFFSGDLRRGPRSSHCLARRCSGQPEMGNSAESLGASPRQHLRLRSRLLLVTPCQRGEYQEKTEQHSPSCAITHTIFSALITRKAWTLLSRLIKSLITPVKLQRRWKRCAVRGMWPLPFPLIKKQANKYRHTHRENTYRRWKCHFARAHKQWEQI